MVSYRLKFCVLVSVDKNVFTVNIMNLIKQLGTMKNWLKNRLVLCCRLLQLKCSYCSNSKKENKRNCYCCQGLFSISVSELEKNAL